MISPRCNIRSHQKAQIAFYRFTYVPISRLVKSSLFFVFKKHFHIIFNKRIKDSKLFEYLEIY